MIMLPGDDTVLGKILADKRMHIEACKERLPEQTLDKRLSDRTSTSMSGAFVTGIRHGIEKRGFGVIAEIKKASPSKGVLCDQFDPTAIAVAYANAGADAISVLTDGPYFQGSDSDLIAARQAAPHVPFLRKDFMLDAYQVKEAALAGASCILLILAALTDEQVQTLSVAARECGLDILAEVHDSDELERALHIVDLKLLGINNRNLKTLDVTLDTFEKLAPLVPNHMIAVCESGITSRNDINRMHDAGAKAFLIGERFMSSNDPGRQLTTLIGHPSAE